MKRVPLVCMVLAGIPLGYAQMTQDQKLSDFQQLVGLFSKRYAFTEWKKQAIQFDSLNEAPWISRIHNSKDDLDFFEICMEYVAANQDGHTTFELPTSFAAYLGFRADLYDGKLLIDSISRKQVTVSDFPVEAGDELVSVDGTPAMDLLTGYLRFINDGNLRSARRMAALLVTYRIQGYIPRAHEIGDTATVVIRRQSGALETYTLVWKKSGYPYTMVGPSPDPESAKEARTRQSRSAGQQFLQSIRNYRAPHTRFDVINASALKPIFALPDTFLQRLGSGQYDDFYTGTFTAGGLTIGYLRYPGFDYFSTTALKNEIAYFESKTDGLIVDVMGNPGGDACTLETFLQYFMPNGFHSMGQSIRATWDFVMAYQEGVDYAIQDGSYTDEEIAGLQAQADAVRAAYSQNRGFTDPLPLCSLSQDIPALTDRNRKSLAYSKPIMVLADEMSYSASELFTAIMQDEGRALIYGMRTDGAGGSPGDFSVGVYMEGGISLAQMQALRKNRIKSAEYPMAPLIENIGVLPDTVSDYMTTENLLQQGKPFVDGFTQRMVDYINSKKE